jgi:MFS transporter, DHA2 family, methylenomycin A resistance protein
VGDGRGIGVVGRTGARRRADAGELAVDLLHQRAGRRRRHGALGAHQSVTAALGAVRLGWSGHRSARHGVADYGAIEAGAAGFGTPRVLAAFAVAAMALTAFVSTESRVAHPMVPLRLFRSREVRVSIAVGFAFVVGYYGLPFVMSLYLQQLRGLSSFGAGLVFLPMMVIGATLTPASARLVERLGARRVITTGLVLLAGGLVVLASVSTTTPTGVLALMMMLVGLAGPLTIPPVTAVLLNSVGDHEAGTGSGVFNTSRQIGGALAVAVFGRWWARATS